MILCWSASSSPSSSLTKALGLSRPSGCASDRVAKLNERGRKRQIVLSYCDGTRSVAEVQALVRREHPDLFASAHAASDFITQVLSWETSE